EAHYRLGVAYGHLRRHNEALECFRRAISLRPDYTDAHMNLGVVYLLLNKRAEAIEQYRKLQDLNASVAKELYKAIYKGKILTVSQ
ncbi:MAG TPA: tetratricopeptide repeat protein, partial [Pyrinomonadaceae bacterium]|nr:tetratricopeptide repeat protein [Pyrinomonadaceae bacterium]